MIRCSVQGQELIVGSPVIAADSINYLTADFNFRTPDWDGLIKIAHFSNGEKSADIPLVDDKIASSAGLNLSEGEWLVSVTGHLYYAGTLVQRITTTRAKLTVKPSVVPDGEPIESLPSYGEQILGAVEEINEKLGSFTAEAETLPEGSEATATYDGQHFSFGIPTGPKGDPGADGFSPSAMVSKSGRTTTITITDKNRTTTANVFDGTNGFSPTATVEKVGNASTITITDKNGTTTATVYDDAALRDDVNDLKTQTNAVNSWVTDGLAQYGNDMFRQGDWSTSTVATKVNSTKAIRIEHSITIHAGDKLITKPGTKVTYMGWNLWNANGEKVETGYEYTTYKRTIQDKTVTFAHDGTLEISVANGPNSGNSSAITPDDMDAVVIIQNSLAKRIETELTNYESATDNSLNELHEFTTNKAIDETPSVSEPNTVIYYPYHFKAGQTYIAHIKFTAFASAGNRKYSLRTTTGKYISSAYTVQGFAVVDGTNPVIGEEYVYKILAKTRTDGSEGQYLAVEINSKSGELSEAELQVYSIKAEDAQTELDKLDYITATDIISLNHDLPMRIAEGNKPLVNATTYPLKLLHFSDIHGDATNLQRIVDLKNHLGAKIDDTICTGDMVYNNYSETCMDFWDGVDGAENILMVVGNHELADGQHGYGSDQIGQTLAYEKYISPYASNWNVTLAGTNLTYWFKDYAARKVRLIGLNYLLTGDELTAQNTWLAERLAEAKTAGYAVVIAEHCPGNAFVNVECGFSVIGHPWTYNEFPVSIQETVQTFIDGGGEFACYLCGHSHRDYVGYNSNFPDQLFIVVTCAFPNATSNDMYRAVGTKAQDAANIVFVDTVTKTVKLVRVGADTDCYLRGRNLFSIKYTDKTVIANS